MPATCMTPVRTDSPIAVNTISKNAKDATPLAANVPTLKVMLAFALHSSFKRNAILGTPHNSPYRRVRVRIYHRACIKEKTEATDVYSCRGTRSSEG